MKKIGNLKKTLPNQLMILQTWVSQTTQFQYLLVCSICKYQPKAFCFPFHASLSHTHKPSESLWLRSATHWQSEVGELCSCLMLQKEHCVEKIKPAVSPHTTKSVMKENLKSEADDSCSASSKPSSKARFAPCAIHGVIAWAASAQVDHFQQRFKILAICKLIHWVLLAQACHQKNFGNICCHTWWCSWSGILMHSIILYLAFSWPKWLPQDLFSKQEPSIADKQVCFTCHQQYMMHFEQLTLGHHEQRKCQSA